MERALRITTLVTTGLVLTIYIPRVIACVFIILGA